MRRACRCLSGWCSHWALYVFSGVSLSDRKKLIFQVLTSCTTTRFRWSIRLQTGGWGGLPSARIAVVLSFSARRPLLSDEPRSCLRRTCSWRMGKGTRYTTICTSVGLVVRRRRPPLAFRTRCVLSLVFFLSLYPSRAIYLPTLGSTTLCDQASR